MAALRAAVLKLFAKNRWGGHNMPPSSARVNALSLRCPQIVPKSNGLTSIEQNSKNSCIYKKVLSVIHFDSVQTRDSFSQHHIFLVETRRINYKLTLKGHVENLTKGQRHDVTGKGHVAYQVIRIVGLNTAVVVSSL